LNCNSQGPATYRIPHALELWNKRAKSRDAQDEYINNVLLKWEEDEK